MVFHLILEGNYFTGRLAHWEIKNLEVWAIPCFVYMVGGMKVQVGLDWLFKFPKHTVTPAKF